MKTLLLTISLLLFPFQAICKTNNSLEVEKYLKNTKNIPKTRLKKHAIIQILDKTTAKSLDQKIVLKEKFSYGNLQIIAHKCWQSPLSQKPDSKILLEINEISLKDKSDIKNIFTGWMISSSPSISGLEHPIYDITALNCQD